MCARSYTQGGVSRLSTFLTSRRDWRSGWGVGGWVQLLAGSVIESESPRTQIYFARSRYPGVRRRPASTPNSSGHCSSSSLWHYSAIQQRGFTSNTMATVCLDRQIFYTPPAAANPKPASRGLLAQNPPSSTVSRTPLHPPPPPSLQDAGDPRSDGTKMSQNDLIEISSDDESDNDSREDGRSYKTLKSGSVAGIRMGLDFPSMSGP